MQIKDTEAVYVSSQTAQLIGDIVGSPELGTRIFKSLLQPGEQATERNLQRRLREAILEGNLQDIKGVGPKVVRRLQSALMLGKALHTAIPMTGAVAEDPWVAATAMNEITWSPVEMFCVLVLDAKHRILSTRIVSVGTATETLAHPREIFRTIIKAGGTRCIVGHNHPSGSLEPSPEDITLTKQLLEASKMIGIPVLDHLIVSNGDYQSIRQMTDLWAANQ